MKGGREAVSDQREGMMRVSRLRKGGVGGVPVQWEEEVVTVGGKSPELGEKVVF